MKIELLPPDRWPELARACAECRSDNPLPTLKPEQSIMLAAFNGDRIVGVVGAERTWHASPLWVDEKERGNGLPAKLISAIQQCNTEGLAEMLVTTNPHVERLVHRIGFLPISGVIWRRT